MNTSLRDQLLKAGLVTEKQARQAAQQEQQRQYRDRSKPNPSQGSGQGTSHNPGTGKTPGRNAGPNSGHGANPNSGRGANPSVGPGANPNTGQGASRNAGHGANPSAGRGANPGASPPGMPSAQAGAQQAQAAKIARDRELNRRREDKAQRKARMAQIEQMVEQNRVPRLETEDYYSFLDGRKIRRMSVDVPRRQQLTSGELVIVRYKGHYAVVPKAIAERIRERDPNMVVPIVQPKAGSEPDDAYKDFVVPDDLMW